MPRAPCRWPEPTAPGLALHRLPDPHGLEHALAALASDALPAARWRLPGPIGTDLAELLVARAGCPDAIAPALAKLCRAAIDLLQAGASAPGVLLRLDRVDGDACRRWHCDNVALRLIATLRGPGTQWVAPEHAEAALVEQQAYAGPILTVPPFTAALMRGRPRLGAEEPGGAEAAGGGMGVVHRSPPLAGTGLTRLVLVLDPLVPPDM